MCYYSPGLAPLVYGGKTLILAHSTTVQAEDAVSRHAEVGIIRLAA